MRVDDLGERKANVFAKAAGDHLHLDWHAALLPAPARQMLLPEPLCSHPLTEGFILKSIDTRFRLDQDLAVTEPPQCVLRY